MNPPARACPTLPSCAELEELLRQRNSEPHRHRELDQVIFRKFRRTRAVFILDMAGFSISVQRYGIIHHLAKIHRMQEAVAMAVGAHSGSVVKFEADNAFATFATVGSAVAASVRLNSRLAELNAAAGEADHIHVSIGIGYGPILLACDDLFGDEVNMASKLGEDIADSGEVLLTARAKQALRTRRFKFAHEHLTVSGVRIRAARLVE